MPFSLQALTRHYYETRRAVLAAAGITMTPWYQLTADERAVAEAEARIVEEAVRRSIEEHQVLTALERSRAARTAPAVPWPTLLGLERAAAAGV